MLLLHPSRIGLLVALLASSALLTVAACGSDDEGALTSPDGGAFDLDGSTGDGTADGAVTDEDGGGDGSVGPLGPLGPVVQLSAGRYHTCARRESGAITCWGDNTSGQLGNGQRGPAGEAQTPQVAVGLTDAVQVAAGEIRTCAVRANGMVPCWGGRTAVGNGVTDDVLSPRPTVSSLDAGTPFEGAVEVGGTGSGYTCARRANGTVTCWSEANRFGRNGDGTNEQRNVPGVDVVDLTDAIGLGVNYYHACALRANGEVVCWGMNTSGQLGTGNTTPSAIPVAAVGVTGGVEIAAGQNQTCVRQTAGTVMCWGINNTGQLGNGLKVATSSTPTSVVGLTDATQLAGGSNHFCAIRQGGSVVCWGSNEYGQVGDGTEDERLTPTAVSGLTDAVEIAGGLNHTCARRATGAVVCWGSNDRGQLGNPDKVTTRVPTEVVGL